MTNFKGILKIVASVAFINSAMAVNDPNWERPIMEAKVDIAIRNTNSFEGAHNIKVTLNQKNQQKNPTSISVDFENSTHSAVNIALAVTQIREDECGSMVYVAQKFFNGHRQAITLIDHSKRSDSCDEAPATWVVQVRDGEGFCGTMDGVMLINAEPTPVYTIAQIINPILDR